MDSKTSAQRKLLIRLRNWLFPKPSQPALTSSEMPVPPAFEPHQLLTNLFLRLHQAGFNLGVPELLAALAAVNGGWGASDLSELAEVARLLWCKSLQDRVEFDIFWEMVVSSSTSSRPIGEGKDLSQIQSEDLSLGESSLLSPLLEEPQLPAQPSSGMEPAPLPIRTPFVSAIESDKAIHTYWPLSRRSMIYAWRYLRHPVPDGPADVLDVGATVSQVARQGFYLAPVYRRRESNHAHLILLVDQGGSMSPLHRFTRDLVETAQSESNIQAVEAYYFHNVPGNNYYRDPHLTERIPTAQALQQCTSDSSVLIVSDAGAARGVRHMERIRATARFVASLKERTVLIAWLNPMPRSRWLNTSAQFIAGIVPMYPMDPEGMSNALDLLRGQQ